MAPQATDPFASIATPIATPPTGGSASASSDPFASIATDIPPEQSTLSKVGSAVGGFFKGAGEGATTAAGETIQSLPYIGKKIITPEAMQAERALFAPGTTAEKSGQYAGKIAEPVLEFVLGDEALKGLALADKVGLAGKISQIAAEHPYIGKLLQHGVAAARMGTVGTTEALAKGATPGEAVKTGVAAGVGGELASTAIEAAAPTVAKVLTNPWKTAQSVAAKFTGSDIQPALKAGINDVWSSVAKAEGIPAPSALGNAGIPVKVGLTPSVQDTGEQVADSILARSKANYRMIDEATGNRFSPTEAELKNVNRALRSVTNDAEENALMVRKQRLEMQMDNLMDEAKKSGVSQAHVDAAKADFKKAQAIYDTNHAIRMSTTGVRPGMKGAEEVPEEVNAKSLMNRLNKLHNSGRLQEAVGDDAAEDLIGHTAIAQKAAKDAARRRLAAEIAIPTVAGTAAEAYRVTH